VILCGIDGKLPGCSPANLYVGAARARVMLQVIRQRDARVQAALLREEKHQSPLDGNLIFERLLYELIEGQAQLGRLCSSFPVKFDRDSYIKASFERFIRLPYHFPAGLEIIVNSFVESLFERLDALPLEHDKIVDGVDFPMIYVKCRLLLSPKVVAALSFASTNLAIAIFCPDQVYRRTDWQLEKLNMPLHLLEKQETSDGRFFE
jgi:hypothetical protein